MSIKLFIKLILLSFFSLKLYAHDPKNCDVLQNYDFSGFESWKIEVVNRSSEYGLDEDFVSKLIAPYEVNKRVIENDKCQPEFTLTFSEYIEKRNSDTRIQNGLNNKSKYNDLLNKIDKFYNVQSRFILSIWGLETAYGKITGNYPVLESLLTMSYDERRRRYFTKELYNALKILEQGHIDVANFKGSWAGAMGQNQFMPSSFLNYAQDFNNDAYIGNPYPNSNNADTIPLDLTSDWTKVFIDQYDFNTRPSDIEINNEEKCVKLTKAMFDKYMKHLVQDKYKDFKTWQNKFKDNRLVLVKSKVTKKWSYWGSFEVPSTDDFI